MMAVIAISNTLAARSFNRSSSRVRARTVIPRSASVRACTRESALMAIFEVPYAEPGCVCLWANAQSVSSLMPREQRRGQSYPSSLTMLVSLGQRDELLEQLQPPTPCACEHSRARSEASRRAARTSEMPSSVRSGAVNLACSSGERLLSKPARLETLMIREPSGISGSTALVTLSVP